MATGALCHRWGFPLCIDSRSCLWLMIRHGLATWGSRKHTTEYSHVLCNLSIRHQTSSPYHPESQGALERWHQTLKSMLRKYCLETEGGWDEGVPYVVVLKENILSSFFPRNVYDYVHEMRNRLHDSCELAHQSLLSVQTKMKNRYDKKVESCEFKEVHKWWRER